MTGTVCEPSYDMGDGHGSFIGAASVGDRSLRVDADDRNHAGRTEAAFALAHRLRGICLTPELFASAEFACGVTPVPRD
ncbi:DUF6461 domain-containing protein [Streptomyces sp. NPDC006385]|uniref:DUF6461 domain-containing protein n=1 Tax=Streptomyces sp. NPDC006385 TaxID=3156761 RepID=UPI0033BC3E6E